MFPTCWKAEAPGFILVQPHPSAVVTIGVAFVRQDVIIIAIVYECNAVSSGTPPVRRIYRITRRITGCRIPLPVPSPTL